MKYFVVKTVKPASIRVPQTMAVFLSRYGNSSDSLGYAINHAFDDGCMAIVLSTELTPRLEPMPYHD